MGKRPFKREPETLGNVLDRLLKRLDIDFEAQRIWEVWTEVVGQSIAGRAHPESIKRKTLCVTVSNSAWLQDLQFRRESIIEAINAKFGRSMIDQILFKIGPVEGDGDKAGGSASVPSGPMQRKVHNELEEHLAKIKDPELRESIRRAIERRERER